MLKQLIPEELNGLIQEYLTDGVLTDKERQVILKKAEGLGLDRDEIDLYLDAQVQKIDQASDAAVRRQKGKACPYCGAPIPQLADKCPECGQFITPEASNELKEIIDNLEEALIDLKSGKDINRSKATVERYARKAKLYFSNNPKIKPLLEEVEMEMTEAEKKAKSRQQKDAFVSFWGKKWIRIVMVIVVGFAILFGGLSKCESANNMESYDYSSYIKYEQARNNTELIGAVCFLVGLGITIVGVRMLIKSLSAKDD